MTPGRNDPCPCGSGKRYKHCCGSAQAATPSAAPDLNEIATLVRAIHAGQPAQAEAHAQERLAGQPDSGLLWKVLSVAQMRQGKDALPALRRTVELLPQDPEAHVNLGAALRARGAYEEALASLRTALTLAPRNLDALLEGAEVQRAAGRASEAVTLYQWALEIDPNRAAVWNNLGNALLMLPRAAEAVRCYRRALELAPEEPGFLCNLGDAMRQNGEPAAALTAARRAIARAPQFAAAYNLQGVLLASQGERAAAIASYREALRLNPRSLETLHNLSAALLDEGARAEAIELCQRALEIAPQRADGHYNLGFALFEARRIEESLDAFRRALELRPDYVAAQLGFASALRALGHIAQAEKYAQAALRLEPRRADVHVLIGELCGDQGRFAQAEESFRRALEIDPDCAPALSGIANHRRMQAEDGPWREGAERALRKGPRRAEEIQLRSALGKYFDDLKDYDRAFASYRDANELAKSQHAAYDAAGLTSLIERVQAFSAAALAPVPVPDPALAQRAVFIIGMPRSGTSLAEQILASHSAVYGAGEVRFWDRAFTRLERRGPKDAAALGGVAQEYLARIGSEAGSAARIIDKLPANFLYAGLIHAALPQARFIHMTRHPLDTCLSVYFQSFFNVGAYANDLEALAHYYRAYRSSMAHWEAVLPAQCLLEVPYESLVEDSESWTRRMLDFIGLPFEPACLEFWKSERVVRTASRWQVRQKLSRASIGRWRHYEKHLGPLLPLLAAAAPRAAAS